MKIPAALIAAVKSSLIGSADIKKISAGTAIQLWKCNSGKGICQFWFGILSMDRESQKKKAEKNGWEN